MADIVVLPGHSKFTILAVSCQ